MPSPPSAGPPRVNGALPTAPEDPEASGETNWDFKEGKLERQ